MARIFWTAEEKQAVAVRAFEIRNYASFDDSDIEAVRQAMAECLGDEKQRKLTTMSEVPWVRESWNELQQVQKTANGRIWVDGTHNVEVTAVKPKPQAIIPVVNPKVEIDSIPQLSVKDTLKEIPTLDLWAELGNRINQLMSGEHLKQLIRDEVNATLERRLPGILPPDEVQTPVVQVQAEQRVHKLKVCIIGLLNGQQELIKQEYRNKIDFLFFDKTPSLSKVKQTAQHYDFVVQMIKYSDQIKGVNQIQNFHMLGGLLTQIREFLNRHVSV
jgi:hypothetical protein